ncbi:MAG: hypothetical protein HY675_15350 [Chloroflexi bacterium]|nr:hypothetical protein [Chloroflexota bacterium]
MSTDIPTPPARVLPDKLWEHFELYRRVKEAITSLPFYFKTDTVISGLIATDIFTLTQLLAPQ